MKSPSNWTVARMKQVISHDWFTLLKLSESTETDRLLTQALEAALDGETRHRRFGRHFTNGSASYRLSATLTARMIVVQWVGRYLADPKPPGSWVDVTSTRQDVVFAYGLAEHLLVAGKAPERFATLDIDYAADVAGP